MYRIVVSVDIEAKDATEAYEKLYNFFNNHPEISWESTDEWFDNLGVEIPPEEISRVRQEVLSKKE